MSVNNRIKLFCNWYTKKYGITQKELSELVEISPSQLSSIVNGRDKVGLLIVEKFLNLKTSLNAHWLITGDGEMFSDSDNNHTDILNEAKPNHSQTRPRIPLHAAAGSLTIAESGVMFEECEQLPIIESLPKYDFTIRVRGNSMVPEFHSGDEVACLFIREQPFIQWGRIHVLDTAQGIIMKMLDDGGDCYICRSANASYKEFKIPKPEVYNIALVVGLVRTY